MQTTVQGSVQSGGRGFSVPGQTTHQLIIASTVTLAAVLCAKGFYSAAGVIALAAACVCSVIEIIKSETDRVNTAIAFGMVAWFVSTPIVSFFLRLPERRALLTYDRLLLATVAAAILVRLVRPRNRNNETITAIRFEIAWTLLAVIALISVATRSHSVGFAARIAVDSFVLPLAVFCFARRYLKLENWGRSVMASCIVLALLLFATGTYELATGENLFPYAGSELVRAGELRVNGPFSTDSSFAIVSVLLFLFLRAAPGALRIRFDRGGSLVYAIGLAASLAASFLPLYRGVTIGLLVSWAAYELLSRGWLFTTRRRAVTSRVLALVVGIGVCLAISVGVLILAGRGSGSAAVRLADPENLFSRAASWQAALKMVSDNPVLGVGLWNFNDAFEAEYSSEWLLVEEVLDTRIATGAHSNTLWIASELGLAGFLPYAVAMISLLFTGYRAVKHAESIEQRSVAACFLALVAGYSIPGLVLTSGAYSDLNLVFFFLIGLLSRRL